MKPIRVAGYCALWRRKEMEKYGDVLRMVEIEEVSRELCGGTHVGSTAESGLFHLTAETSSAANVLASIVSSTE